MYIFFKKEALIFENLERYLSFVRVRTIRLNVIGEMAKGSWTSKYTPGVIKYAFVG